MLTKVHIEKAQSALKALSSAQSALIGNPCIDTTQQCERASQEVLRLMHKFGPRICSAARAWLDVQPVKIKDLPIDCDSAIGFRGDGLHIIFRFGMDRWSTSAISRLWDDEDCAIPLSAILALKTR